MTIDDIIISKIEEKFDLNKVKLISYINNMDDNKITILLEKSNGGFYEMNIKHNGCEEGWILNWNKLKRNQLLKNILDNIKL